MDYKKVGSRQIMKGYVYDEFQGMTLKVEELIERVQKLETQLFGKTYEKELEEKHPMGF